MDGRYFSLKHLGHEYILTFSILTKAKTKLESEKRLNKVLF